MSLDTQTKLAIYRHFAETGQRPSLQVVAERVGSDLSSIREAYGRLRAQRVLVLESDGVSIRMAPPFSGVPTQHAVIVVTRTISLTAPGIRSGSGATASPGARGRSAA
jgi:hypothetical protein